MIGKDDIRIRCDHGILTITLDRPTKLNALTPPMLGALDAAFRRAQQDDVRIVLLRGSGRAFCAGADVEQALGATDIDTSYGFLSKLAAVLASVSSLPKPVLAAVQGHAIGGGAELALEADLLLIADDAVLSFPDVALGSTPASAYQLVRRVGKGLAARMLMLGTKLTAQDMQRLEMVVGTVAQPELHRCALRLADSLRDRASARSLQFAKEALAIAERSDRAVDLRANVAAMLACQSGKEQRNYVARFSARTCE